MKVTALVVVLGLVAGALASEPEAVLTVFGNFAETKRIQGRLLFARIGTEEFITNFIAFNINGKTIQIGIGFKLSASVFHSIFFYFLTNRWINGYMTNNSNHCLIND